MEDARAGADVCVAGRVRGDAGKRQMSQGLEDVSSTRGCCDDHVVDVPAAPAQQGLRSCHHADDHTTERLPCQLFEVGGVGCVGRVTVRAGVCACG